MVEQTGCPLSSGASDILYSIYFANADTGYAVGVVGSILKTSDAGTHWTSQTSGTNYHLSSVYFTNSNTGYAVGLYGTIIKTIDGGVNWLAQTSGTNEDLGAVYFTSFNTGYAAGFNGTITKTIDGGTNWTTLNSGTIEWITSLYFADDSTGYAVTWEGNIIKTINGGNSWTSQSSGTTNHLYSVYFTDTLSGYIAGGSGIILKTTDGGANWASMISGTTNDLYSVYFIDSLTGYTVGVNGIILNSIDGGNNWTSQSSGTTNTLSSVIFLSTNAGNYSGYTAGAGGTILKTTIKAITAGNNGPVCAGTTLSLTSTTVAGATYAWTGPDNFTSTQQNPVVSIDATTDMSGTYYVTLNGNSSPSDSTTVVVNAIPATPTAGNNGPVNVGASLSLTASTVVGATYAWTGPDSFTSTLQNPLVSNSATISMAGTYSVNLTLNGCTSLAGTTLVVINLSNDSACGTQGFDNGKIAPPGWIFTHIDTTYNSAANSGNAIPSLKFDATGDAVETAPVHDVSQLSFWIKGNSTNATTHLLVAGYDGTNWITIDSINPIPTTGTTKTYTNNLSAYINFRFTYTKGAGNMAFDDVKIVCGTNIGVDELANEKNLSIYPNPATDKVFINISKEQDLKMQVYNMIGECVLQKELYNRENEINISSLSKGIYIIQLTGADKSIQHKLIKE